MYIYIYIYIYIYTHTFVKPTHFKGCSDIIVGELIVTSPYAECDKRGEGNRIFQKSSWHTDA